MKKRVRDSASTRKNQKDPKEFVEADASKYLRTTYTYITKIGRQSFKANANTYGIVRARKYKSKENAFAVSKILQDVKNAHICDFLALDVKRKEKCYMLMERGYSYFGRWLRTKSPIWEYDCDFTKVVSMGVAFLKVFNGIISGLRALHRQDKCHGNLKKGVMVSKNYDVKLVNISPRQDDIEKGIRKDLRDFTDMVREVVTQHPPATGGIPDSINLFLKFGEMFDELNIHKSIKLSKSRYHAYFVYHNPLFADATRRRIVTNKFIQLNQEFRQRMKKIKFAESDTSLGFWWARLHHATYCYRRFYHNHQKLNFYKENPLGMLNFYRDCFFHSEAKGVDSAVAVELSLNEMFPDFLPKLYYEFVKHVAWEKCGRLILDNLQTLPPIFQ